MDTIAFLFYMKARVNTEHPILHAAQITQFNKTNRKDRLIRLGINTNITYRLHSTLQRLQRKDEQNIKTQRKLYTPSFTEYSSHPTFFLLRSNYFHFFCIGKCSQYNQSFQNRNILNKQNRVKDKFE